MLLKESWGAGEPVQKPWIAITDKREIVRRLFRFANKAWQLCEEESTYVGEAISTKLAEELNSADRAMKKISRMLEISANPNVARDEDEILEIRTDLMSDEFKRPPSALRMTDIRYFATTGLDLRTVSRMQSPTYFRRPNVFVKEMLDILTGDCGITAIPPECYEKITGIMYGAPVLPRLVKRPKGAFNKALHLWFGQGSTLAEIGRHGGNSYSVPIVFSIEAELPYTYVVSQGISPAEKDNLVVSITLPWLNEIHEEAGDPNISNEAYERRSDFLSSIKPLLANTGQSKERYGWLYRIAEVIRKAEIYFSIHDSTSWFFRSVVKPYWESLERRDARDAIRRYSETSVEQESTTATS